MKKNLLKLFRSTSNATQWFAFVFFGFIFLFSVFQIDTVETAPVPKNAPNVITYQGKLMENSLAVTTTKAFGFLIYDASSGGNLLYTASGTLSSTSTLSIVPTQGIFSVDMGGSGTNELTSSTFSNNTQLYLEVWVGSTKLTPRKQLTSAPFALNSQFLLGISPTTTSSGLYIPHSDANGNFNFTGTPQSGSVGGGVIYINPGSASNEQTLFGIGLAGTERFRVDEDGDVFITGALNVTSTLNVVSSSTLATTTFSGSLTVSNGASTALFVDRINSRVGIASSSPAFPLSVVGQSYFSATSTVQDLSVLDGILLGGTKQSSWSSFAFLSGNQTYTGTNTFNVTTTLVSTTINGILNVDSGTFYVDAANNRVGVSTSTPSPYSLSVGGTSYFTGTSTFGGRVDLEGHVLSPREIGVLATGVGGALLNGAAGIVVEGDYAYIAAGSSSALEIVNISNPANPQHVGSLSNGAGGGAVAISLPYGLAVSGNYVYIGSRLTDKLEIVDVSNPASPIHAAVISDGAGGASINDPYNVVVSGNYAYIPSFAADTLEILDISNPLKPKHAGKIANGTGGALLSGAFNVFVSGKYAYVASFSSNALEIVDVSDPKNPIHMGSLSHGSGGALLSAPKSVFVSGKYAYVASSGSDALEIVDVSNPASPTHAGSISNSGSTLIDAPSTVVVSGRYAYLASYDSNGFEVVDISSSTVPKHVASITGSNLQGATGIDVQGNYAYVTSLNQHNIDIIDITGSNISNVAIGSGKIGSLQVDNSTRIGGSLFVKNGLQVGNNGLALGGDLAISSNSTTTVATNTLSFSHIAKFQSNATTSNKNLFVFDTINTYAQGASTTAYLLSVRNNGVNAFSVASNGDVAASGTFYAASISAGTPGSPGDLAERVDIAVDDNVEPGDVVVVDSENTDTYRRSSGPYEQSVAGVISTNPTLIIGFGQTKNTAVLALVGRVPIKVSTENGPIHRGDVLVTASSTGYAMRYDSSLDDNTQVVGIIGVALESLNEGSGKIMGLVRTGWVNSRHKTIADIQQELVALAEAQSSAQISSGLTVTELNGNLTFLAHDLDMGGHSILNIGKLAGKDGKWEVDAQGRFITRLTMNDGEKSLYSMQSGETQYVFSGSAQLQGGVVRVDFDAQTREIIDAEKPMKINITLTAEANGVYMSGKDGTGFVVKELQNGTSNATFDYVVIATRKVEQDVVGSPTSTGENTPAPEEVVVPPSPPVDEGSASSTPPVVEDQPAAEPTPTPAEESATGL